MVKTQSKKGPEADDKPPMDKTEIIGKELIDQADKVGTQVNQGVEKKVEQTDFRKIIDDVDVSETYKCPPPLPLLVHLVLCKRAELTKTNAQT